MKTNCDFDCIRKINHPDMPVILFVPEAGIHQYMRGLAILGDAVIKKGGKVYVTRDSGQLLRTPIMTMHRIPPGSTSHKKIKIINNATSKVLKAVKKKYNFSIIELSDFIDQEIINEVNLLIENSKGDLENIYFRGFPVGKISQYDFILETKFKYSSKLSEEHQELYIMYIKNTALTLAITDRICQTYKPSLILTFNEYAQCQAVRYSAEAHNVSRMAITYPVHFNVDGSRFFIWKETCEYWRYTHFQNWYTEKDTPIETKYITACWEDALFRMYGEGSHIFSTSKQLDPEDIFKKLNLDPLKKTLVVYTSSQDERGSVEIGMKIWKETLDTKDAFINQIEWLTMLQNYISARNDLQIIVRIHPREGARHGEGESEHLKKIRMCFPQTKSSFIIVWPEDPISSYDLLEIADVCLVAWSLMGQEAARLGLPVLSYTENMIYPNDDFIQVASTKEEYKNKLDAIINMEYTLKHLIKAIRFYHWRIFIPSLDLSETVPLEFNVCPIWPNAPINKVEEINSILSGKLDLITSNIENWKKSIHLNSADLEIKVTKKEIRKFIHKIFYPPKYAQGKLSNIFKYLLRKIVRVKANLGLTVKRKQENFLDYDLKFSTKNTCIEQFREKTRINKNLRIIVADGPYATLIHNGKIKKRMSKMIIKLAKIHESNWNDSSIIGLE